MTGRHRHKASRIPGSFIAGSVSVVTGLGVGIAAIAELLRYSPYENPGAGRTGGLLALAAVFLIGAPLLLLATGLVGKAAHEYSAFRKTLSPGERAALDFAQAAVMTGAGAAWHRHNKEQDARLTASVMGKPPRDDFTTVA